MNTNVCVCKYINIYIYIERDTYVYIYFPKRRAGESGSPASRRVESEQVARSRAAMTRLVLVHAEKIHEIRINNNT